MLTVDLGRLQRAGKLEVEGLLVPDDPALADLEARLTEPLQVRLEAHQAGPDVVVRGRMQGELELECARCLKPVRRTLNEEVTLLYVEGVDEVAAEDQEVYALPDTGWTLDLEPALREHLVLAAPTHALCREDCRGLCPTCGADRNEAPCECEASEVDDRWAALRRLGSE